MAELGQPIKYNPKILLLENKEVGKVLWFAYWLSTFWANYGYVKSIRRHLEGRV